MDNYEKAGGGEVKRADDEANKLSAVEIVLLSFSIVMALLSDFKSIEALKYVACIIPIAISIVHPLKSLYVIAFIFLNNTTLTLFGINVYTIISAIVTVELFLFRRKAVLPIHVFLFLSYGVLQSLLYMDFSLLFKEYIKVILVLIYILNMFAVYKDRQFALWKRSVVYMILGACVTCLLAIVINRQGLHMARFDISTNNTVNFVGIQMAILSMYAIIFFLSAKTHRTAYIIAIGVMAVIGLLTTSRTFIIAYIMGVALILMAFGCATNSKWLLRSVCFALLLLVLAVIALKYTNLGESFAYLIRRFVDPTNKDISNGRFEIWNEYMQTLKNDELAMIFGAGTYTNLGIKDMAHNMFIEVFTTYGICGTFLFIYSYADTARVLVRKTAAKCWQVLVGCVPLLVVLATGMSSHSLASFPSTMQLFFGILAIYNVSVCFRNGQGLGGSNENTLGNSSDSAICR